MMNNGTPNNSQLSILNYQSLLKKYWGYDDFRGIQREIIESIGAGHDTLGLMPTGGGKSVTFQVPALAMKGVCIVITPLIALMKDQVHHLRQRGVIAAAIYSGMQHDKILTVLENCIMGSTKLLYVSPERLGSELFQTKLRHMQVSFITVDEAHCISQWGYDFRPSYLQIADIRRICPNVPVLALTATATPKVVADICDKLQASPHQGRLEGSSPFNVFRMSFERKNLTYLVSHAVDKRTELIRLLDGEQGSAIVYVRSRRHAREVAELLTDAGLSATFYHAGLEHAQKDQRQRDWQHDRVRIMVATNAFGMGIDKPDVRIVAHYDCPDSIEAYYYQIATGDGYGVAREFNIDDFSRKFNHFPIRVHAALQILQRAGYLEYTEEQDNQARVRFLVTRDDLYRLRGDSPNEEKVIVALLRNYGGLFADFGFIDESVIASQCGLKSNDVYQTLKVLAMKHVIQFIPRRQVPYVRYLQRREDSEHVSLPPSVYEERLTQYRERIESMLRYAKSQDKCRSRQLLEYFGEEVTKDCGQCDVCQANHSHTTEQAQHQILTLLSDHRRHHITEVLHLGLPKEDLDAALTHLLQEEYITQQDGYLML